MKKSIGENEKVPLMLTEEQIEVIVEHTFAEDELLNALKIAEAVGTKRRVKFTLHELEFLEGHVAATANHCEDPNLQRKLDDVCELISKVQGSYDLVY